MGTHEKAHMERTITIKAKRGSDLRRWSEQLTDNELSIDALHSAVHARFGTEHLELKWQDEDGDWIRIVSQDDLNEALRQPSQVLRLLVEDSVGDEGTSAEQADSHIPSAVKDIKAALSALGVSFAGVLEKAELQQMLVEAMTRQHQPAGSEQQAQGSEQPGGSNGIFEHDFVALAAKAAQQYMKHATDAAAQRQQASADENASSPPPLAEMMSQAAQSFMQAGQACGASAAARPQMADFMGAAQSFMQAAQAAQAADTRA